MRLIRDCGSMSVTKNPLFANMSGKDVYLRAEKAKIKCYLKRVFILKIKKLKNIWND